MDVFPNGQFDHSYFAVESGCVTLVYLMYVILHPTNKQIFNQKQST